MNTFLLALQFLTIIPVKIKHIREKNIPNSMIFFPLIGLIIGLILAGTNSFLSFLGLREFSIDIILVVLLIVVTGGMHLDGLADTCDAFFSAKGKEEMLKIMRDSHVGAMGVLSLISAVSLKLAFLLSLGAVTKTVALLLMCILSRWALVFAMFLFPYARQEGKGKVFMQGINLKIFLLATVIAVVLVFAVSKMNGMFIFLIISGLAYLICKFMQRKIGGITGDTLGALNEVVEIIILVIVCILERGNA